MSVKKHYDEHLASIYAWMVGDFELRKTEFKTLLQQHAIKPASTKIALDLGAGHGIQSIALAEAGFKVLAVDFNQQLLDELKKNAHHLDVRIINADIKDVKQFSKKAELIVCCGDTLLHLDSKAEVFEFIASAAASLEPGGKLILSFRDYTHKLEATARFIPVKNDENRILTCVLDFNEDSVTVTDLLHEKINGSWQQKVSAYKKVRLLSDEILACLQENSMRINFNDTLNRFITIIATKSEEPEQNY